MTHSLNISVAPMMDWTDTHCRYFHRLLNPHAVLYTEMVTAQAIIYGNQQKLLGYHQSEHPLVLQLGGSDPSLLAKAAKIGLDFGYNAINLNCGCPSSRVQQGRFGACLMAESELVGQCVAAMRQAVQDKIPITIKTRIGIDAQDSYEFLHGFVSTVHRIGGATHFIIHARKAWLKGLSPKENRTKPPLNYERAYQLAQDLPQLSFAINGGFETVPQILAQSQHGMAEVMVGRAAYHNPYLLAELAYAQHGTALPNRADIWQQMQAYIKAQQVKPHSVTRHILGLYHGQEGAKAWKQKVVQFCL
jgi:tRNA-dihydrouridine synthase A